MNTDFSVLNRWNYRQMKTVGILACALALMVIASHGSDAQAASLTSEIPTKFTESANHTNTVDVSAYGNFSSSDSTRVWSSIQVIPEPVDWLLAMLGIMILTIQRQRGVFS